MRLFAGIDLPAEVRQNLAGLIGRLRPAAALKWCSTDSLHVTTKFIGEWPESRLGELVAALRDLPEREPFQIAVEKLGWFPNPREPRVFWAGVTAPPALADLARDTDNALARLGIPGETRAYSPHLTLARIKDRPPLEGIHRALAALASDGFGEFAADRCYLYLSERRTSGSVYTKLEEFAFARS
jgi:RNA 2',3'-cyclic 3'-phosphodiesterase